MKCGDPRIGKKRNIPAGSKIIVLKHPGQFQIIQEAQHCRMAHLIQAYEPHLETLCCASCYQTNAVCFLPADLADPADLERADFELRRYQEEYGILRDLGAFFKTHGVCRMTHSCLHLKLIAGPQSLP